MAFDFSLVIAPFRMQPGLRRIPPGTSQLTPARPGSRHLREKIAVLQSFGGEALCATPGFDARPLMRAIAAEPSSAGAFVVEDPGGRAFTARAPLLRSALNEVGELVDDRDAEIASLLRALPPDLRADALLCLAFEEDFAAIEGAAATIPWIAVALPSRWAPAEKVGLPFAAVHAPVADNARLLAAAEGLARLVTTDDGARWERFVWTLTPEPRLHQHPNRDAIGWQVGSCEEIAAEACFRSERQTFIPVPGGDLAVFTMRVDSAPLRQAVASADAAMRVHDALASMSAAVLDYRGLAGVREPLLQWLAQQAAAAAPPGQS